MEQTCSLPERRIAARIDVERIVTIEGAGEVRTVNVSSSGMLVETEGSLTIWAEVLAVLPGVGERFARVVRKDGVRYGLVFREALNAAEFESFTGMEVAAEVVVVVADSGPVPRVSPWAFGRDRIKAFRRMAAEQAVPARR